MPAFIKTDRVAVTDDDGKNVVYLRRKLDMGAVLRVQEAVGRGEGLLALYTHSILSWEGPDFRGIKCTPENIEKIDYEDAFWVKVGDKIAELNPKMLGRGGEESPLSPTTDGMPATVASAAAPTVNTTST